jgi:Deoxynucleoside kinase
VGKSSVLDALRISRPQWRILEEPVQEWQSYSPVESININLLGEFYNRPTERAFRVLQTEIFLSLLRRYSYAKTHPAPVVVFERSIEVARDVSQKQN